ncbi:MAG: 4-hydroxybenzoate octaprenyltransferase, partial [Rhodobacteraceae bacterium]|nr:4-hydroxybenzoate octaprenyltransferase [Paracoccaceae bacterium]
AEAHEGAHGLWIAIGCALGAVLMRGAGCTWNDITDRHIDAQVARTRARPLPSAQISLRAARLWMVAQALAALGILCSFPANAILLGLLSLVPAAVYPFAKRITWWPQLFLGIAFNWGALLGWTAHSGTLGWPAVWLYCGGIAWTLFYDTIYAHQDRQDDAVIGVKSTARLLGERSPRWLLWFALTSAALMGIAVFLAGQHRGLASLGVALLGPCAMGAHMLWQLRRLDLADTDGLLHLFRCNRDAGLLLVIALAVALLL